VTPALECHLVRASRRWPAGLHVLARAAIDAARAEIPLRLDGPAEISVLLTSDAGQRRLNARWRGIDRPTNVLSFAARDEGAPLAGPLGDISLGFETVCREAERDRVPLAHHFAHLLVHGFLHILGYDHLTEADAGKMESLEARILARLDIPDPYAGAPLVLASADD